MMKPPLNWPAPALQNLLLEEGRPFKDNDGRPLEAAATGLCVLLGTSRAGKSSLAYALLDWVIIHTKRPVALVGLPNCVVEAMPPHWRWRVSNPSIDEVLDMTKPAVILQGDTTERELRCDPTRPPSERVEQ